MTVYVVQDPRRYDKATGKYTRVFNITPAKEYGELVYLLTPTAAPWNTDSVIFDLWERLGSFGDDDYLLMIGNPILIGWATAIASEVNNGKVAALQWNGKERKYIEVRAQILGLDSDEAGEIETDNGRKGE